MARNERFNKLKGRMVEMGYNQRSLSRAIGLNYTQLSRRMTGQTDFSLTEVIAICKVLNITDPQVYFFTD